MLSYPTSRPLPRHLRHWRCSNGRKHRPSHNLQGVPVDACGSWPVLLHRRQGVCGLCTKPAPSHDGHVCWDTPSNPFRTFQSRYVILNMVVSTVDWGMYIIIINRLFKAGLLIGVRWFQKRTYGRMRNREPMRVRDFASLVIGDSHCGMRTFSKVCHPYVLFKITALIHVQKLRKLHVYCRK